MKKIWLLVGYGFMSAWVSAGCGPCKSTSLIQQADINLYSAKTTGADTISAYEYTLAEQYLRKAREKWGTSDFEYSIDYAAKARDLAIQAREKTLAKQSSQE